MSQHRTLHIHNDHNSQAACVGGAAKCACSEFNGIDGESVFAPEKCPTELERTVGGGAIAGIVTREGSDGESVSGGGGSSTSCELSATVVVVVCRR